MARLVCRLRHSRSPSLPRGASSAPATRSGWSRTSKHLDGDGVVFTRGRTEKDGREIPFPAGGEIAAMGVRVVRVPAGTERESGALYADLDAIPEGAVLRKRREGDRITKFGGGTKSLGDFLTDRKVPLRARDGITVCAAGSDILFAAGVEISERVKVTERTKNTIKITEDKNVR